MFSHLQALDFMMKGHMLADVSAGLGSISKVLRMMLQSGVLAVGAYLVIHQEATAGVIIAGSILSARALAPVDLAIAHWKGFVAARQSWHRLNRLLESLPAQSAPTQLQDPSKRLSVEGVSIVPPGEQTKSFAGLDDVTARLRAAGSRSKPVDSDVWTGTGTPPSAWAATWAQYRRGRLSPITETMALRTDSAFAGSPRACSSMTRSSMLETKVTPLAVPGNPPARPVLVTGLPRDADGMVVGELAAQPRRGEEERHGYGAQRQLAPPGLVQCHVIAGPPRIADREQRCGGKEELQSGHRESPAIEV